MKYCNTFFLILIFVIFESCDESSPRYSGETTLNTTNIGDYPPAFSFSKGKVVPTNNPAADFVVIPLINEGGPLGVYLGSIDLDSNFSWIRSFDTSDSSIAFFDTLSAISSTQFELLAIPVLPNQVWAVKSHDGRFAKILILEIDYYQVNTTEYAEVTFKWVFQPNGSRYF